MNDKDKDVSDNSKSSSNDKSKDADIRVVLIYLVPILTGLLFYMVSKDEKNKYIEKHSIQSILLGVAMIAVYIVGVIISLVVVLITGIYIGVIFSILELLIYLYGLYAGYMALQSNEVNIPYISEIAERYVSR
ncbi:MAG: hypothetical protein ARM1_0531 [Candidatus Micrarchaeota archaeon]|nr:MAG: hypothetical protein ARM1_0531 [Candidatus Micrarchaeota archaeon]